MITLQDEYDTLSITYHGTLRATVSISGESGVLLSVDMLSIDGVRIPLSWIRLTSFAPLHIAGVRTEGSKQQGSGRHLTRADA